MVGRAGLGDESDMFGVWAGAVGVGSGYIPYFMSYIRLAKAFSPSLGRSWAPAGAAIVDLSAAAALSAPGGEPAR